MEDAVETPGRPAPAASGELQRTPFAHLLVYANERRLTGTLEFTHPDGRTAALALVGGHVNKVRTSETIVHLGRVLLELGIIAQDVLDWSLATLASHGGLHGQILIRCGAITQEQLVFGLEVQLARKLAHLFTYPPETQFAFYDHFDSLGGYGGSEALSVDLLPVIWRGICLAPPWEHVDAALSRVTHARVRAKPTATLERFHFESDVASVVPIFAQQPVVVSHFIGGGILSASAAQLLLYCLIITRQIDVVETPQPAEAPQVPQAAPVAQAAPVTHAAPVAPPTVRIEPMSQSRISIGGTRGPASGQFAVTRLVTEAAPPSRSGEARSGEARSGEARSGEGHTPLGASSDHAARRAEIGELAGTIEKMTYFEMLGVGEDASPADVEAAFVNLAKRWHPDRLPASLADIREPCTRVFGRLSEAHKALMDPEGRQRYIALLKDGSATPEAQAYIARVVDASTTFQKAEVCLKRSDFAQAEALCRQAHEADDTQADYVALLAWLESMHPENQNAAASYQRIAMLDRALLMNAKCERAYYYRGLLHKKVGSVPLAIEDFRRAADLNPKNVDAVREIRLYGSRKSSIGAMPAVTAPGQGSAGGHAGESKLSGLFGKLLKKD